LGSQVANITINGNSPIPVLQHIAEQTKYDGLVICDLRIGHGATEYNIAQFEEMIGFYKTVFLGGGRFNNQFNLRIVEFLQERFVFFSTNIRLKWLLERRIPFYLKTLKNRSKMAYYRKMIPESDLKKNTLPATPQTSSESDAERWLKTVDLLEAYAGQIKTRGGRVLFVRMPGDPPQVEECFPRTLFWNELERKGLTSLHCSDEGALSCFSSPDDTHLDAEDAPEFTKRLSAWLLREGLFESREL